jgi:hypothetical protein
MFEAIESMASWDLQSYRTAVKPFWTFLDLSLVHFFEVSQVCKAIGVDFCHEENAWINKKGVDVGTISIVFVPGWILSAYFRQICRELYSM